MVLFFMYKQYSNELDVSGARRRYKYVAPFFNKSEIEKKKNINILLFTNQIEIKNHKNKILPWPKIFRRARRSLIYDTRKEGNRVHLFQSLESPNERRLREFYTVQSF